MRSTLGASLGLALLTSLLGGATARADAYDDLNGAEQHVVDSLSVGGSPIGATPRLRAIALARGGGTPAEQHRLRTLEIGGSVWGQTNVERRAVQLRKSGAVRRR
jgi:hypothetical protein